MLLYYAFLKSSEQTGEMNGLIAFDELQIRSQTTDVLILGTIKSHTAVRTEEPEKIGKGESSLTICIQIITQQVLVLEITQRGISPFWPYRSRLLTQCALRQGQFLCGNLRFKRN